MQLRQFQYLIHIIDSGSLSRASQALHIAQPALSQQINQFEEELGVKLLTRSVRGVAPTEAHHRYIGPRGVLFYAKARVGFAATIPLTRQFSAAFDKIHQAQVAGIDSHAGCRLRNDREDLRQLIRHTGKDLRRNPVHHVERGARE